MKERAEIFITKRSNPKNVAVLFIVYKGNINTIVNIRSFIKSTI